MNTGYALLVSILPALVSDPTPIKATFAYSRETIPGIPGSSGGAPDAHNPFPTEYFIYVVVRQGTVISSSRVCLRDKSFDATLRRVSAPVVLARDPGAHTNAVDTLVKRTANEVYRVVVGAPRGGCDADSGVPESARHDGVVVCLTASGSRWYGLVARITALPAIAAM